MGSVKPWRMEPNPSLFRNPRAYYERYYLELSPYLHEARKYRAQLGEEDQWLDISTGFGRISHLITFGSPSLQGLSQATFQRLAFHLRNR
jgi:hypothetical protein